MNVQFTLTLRHAVCGAVVLAASAQTFGAAKAPRPECLIPKLDSIPTIDGKHAPGEWDRAAAMTGFIAATGKLGGRMVPVESRIYIGHDGANLYIGMYCELGPGVKPSMRYRRRDEPVYMDNYQMEMWLAPPQKGHLKAFQFIGNAYGAIYDVEHVPALGAVTPGWNGNWKFENAYTQGKEWTAELAIPFKDLGSGKGERGEFWGGMVAVAWPQRSWPYTFGWYKNVDTHAKFYMGDSGTCVRVEDLSSLFDNRLAPKFRILNAEGAAGEFTITAKVGAVTHTETVRVEAGASKELTFQKGLPAFPPKVKKQRCSIAVTGPGGTKLLSGDWFFQPVGSADRVLKATPPKPWAMTTKVNFAPLAMGIKAWADVLDYPKRGRLAKARFVVRAAGGGRTVLSENVTSFGYDAAEKYLWLPKDLAHGKYEVVTEFLDDGGAVLDSKTDAFEVKDLKKEFVWLDSDEYGEKMTVAPPFEPLRTTHTKGGQRWFRRMPAQTAFEVWGRTIVMDGALPGRVSSQGEELLSRPISIVAEANGIKTTARVTRALTVTSSDDVRATFNGAYEVAGLALDFQGYIEFDGTMWYTLVAKPKGGAPRLDRLYISMPVKPERATYYFSTAGGWSPMTGMVADLPMKEMAWSSEETSADFVPYVCLSDDDRGIHWFADTDHDWVLGNDAPCAQIARTPGEVELQVNLVRTRGPVSGFKAQFGFIASPIKKMPSAWRNTCLHFGRVANSKINFFYGPGHGGCPIDPHDTAKLARAMKIDLKGRNSDVVLRDLPPTETEWDIKHLKKVTKGKGPDMAKAQMRRRQNPDPTFTRNCWFFNAKMYFEGKRSKAFRTFFPGDWVLDPSGGWFHLTPVESYRDFFSFHMNLWLKHWIMEGLYFDETYLGPDYNVFNGNGKVMPDGSVRPSIPLMTHQRPSLNRMRQLFIDNDKKPFVWVHTSNYMAPYAISAADIAMFGEDRAPTPQTDIIDTIPALLMRTLGRSQKFGFIPVWMVMCGRGGPPFTLASRQTWGWCWQHDTVPEYHTCARPRPLAIVRQGWGIDRDDVSFVPYWNNADAVASDDEEFIVSIWKRPGGGALLQVMNLNYAGDGATSVALTLNAEGLGMERVTRVLDAESMPTYAEGEAKFVEADRLHTKDPVANKSRISSLTREGERTGRKVTYDITKMNTLSNGHRLQLTVPARDFRTLIVE